MHFSLFTHFLALSYSLSVCLFLSVSNTSSFHSQSLVSEWLRELNVESAGPCKPGL